MASFNYRSGANKMQIKKKQASLILITVIALFIFLWQLVQLLSSDISIKPQNIAPIANASKTPPHTMSDPPTTLVKFKNLRPETKAQQNIYLDLVNRYQMAKIQHKLLEEQLAIANARHQIAELSRKAAAHSISQDRAAVNYGTEGIPTAPETPFKLLYLGYQNGQWSATINYNGHYQQLETNTTLADGTHIILVDQEGVIIEFHQQRYHLTFNHLKRLPPINPSSAKSHILKKPSDNTFVNAQPTLKTTLPIIPNASAKKNNAINIYKKNLNAPRPHTLDETVLLEMPAQSYTIKLFESTNQKHLLSFIKRHHLEDRTLYYSHTKNNILYHTLIYGDYLTTRAALTALNNLSLVIPPKNLSIELLKHIQHEING